jgi:predicted MFS family arabinose efflux permease
VRSRRASALAAALLAFGFAEELWFRYLPAYLRTLGASAFGVGLFGTLKDLLDAGYAYPGGVLSDRLGTRRALLCVGSLSVAGFAVLWLLPSTAGVFAGIVLVMAWSSLGLPATFALVGEELATAGRVRGFTLQAVVKRLPILVAPPLGGLLLARLGMRSGMRVAFAVTIVLSLSTLVGLGVTLRGAPAAADTKPGGGAGRAPVRLAPTLRQLLTADCLVRLCEGLPDVFLVVWAIEVVGVSPPQFGILTSVLTMTSIVSYLPGAVRSGGAEKKPFVLLTYLFFTLFPLAVLASRSFGHLVVAYAIGGLREVGEPARKALIVDLADPETRGRTVGLYYTIRGFAVAGAAAIGGALWTLRPSLTFLTAAALGALGTAWAAAFLPSRSRSDKPEEACS